MVVFSFFGTQKQRVVLGYNQRFLKIQIHWRLPRKIVYDIYSKISTSMIRPRLFLQLKLLATKKN